MKKAIAIAVITIFHLSCTSLSIAQDVDDKDDNKIRETALAIGHHYIELKTSMLKANEKEKYINKMLSSTDWNIRMTGRYVEAWSKFEEMFCQLENIPGIMARDFSYKYNFDSMQTTNGKVIRIDEKFALLFIEWIHKRTLPVVDSEDTAEKPERIKNKILQVANKIISLLPAMPSDVVSDIGILCPSLSLRDVMLESLLSYSSENYHDFLYYLAPYNVSEDSAKDIIRKAKEQVIESLLKNVNLSDVNKALKDTNDKEERMKLYVAMYYLGDKSVLRILISDLMKSDDKHLHITGIRVAHIVSEETDLTVIEEGLASGGNELQSETLRNMLMNLNTKIEKKRKPK